MTTSEAGLQRPTSWPAVQHEDVSWRLPDHMEGRVPASDLIWREAKPYAAAVPPRIAHLDITACLSGPTIESVALAAGEISAFDRETAALPVPMPAVLLRTESASSSQIENLTANSRSIATAALGAPAGGNATLVADNALAMTRALEARGPLTRATILDIHRALLQRTDPDLAGQFRKEPVWIGTPDISPHGADFIPPRHELIEECVADLAAFASRKDANGLTLAALAHAQFETIHPFTDGNGRTGRALVHVVLRDTGFATHTSVPVSAGLLGDVEGYFRALTAYREGDPEPIVRAFAGSARRAIANGRHLAADILATHERWGGDLRARSDSGAWRLARHLFQQPVVNSRHVEEVLGSSKQGAFNAIAALEGAGILTQSSRDRRNQLWQARDVTDAMDAFATRARRRALG